MNTIELGKFGEKHAESYLNSTDFHVLKTNYHCKYGEIDIIAIDRSTPQQQLVFIEVKTRSTETFGQPLEAITRTKMQRLRKTALNFLTRQRSENINSTIKKIPKRWRIDVIGIQLNSDYKFQELIHLKNI